MSRTQKHYLMDQPIPDGKIPFSAPTDFYTYSATAPTVAYSATLGPSLHLGTASTAYTVAIPLASILFRSGMQDDLQEAFGGGATAQVFAAAQGKASPPATFTTPAGVSGPPPFSGVTQFTPVTSARPKGIQIVSLSFVYFVTTTTASANQVGLFEFSYANAAAPTVTTLLATATNGMQTAANTSGQTYVTTVTPTTSAFITPTSPNVVALWNVTTTTSGSVDLIEVVANVNYNFN